MELVDLLLLWREKRERLEREWERPCRVLKWDSRPT
jgi:hypothetical protein